jgi:hypothetical protein
MNLGFHGLSFQSLSSAGRAQAAPKCAEFGGSIQEPDAGGKPPQLTPVKAAGHCPA